MNLLLLHVAAPCFAFIGVDLFLRINLGVAAWPLLAEEDLPAHLLVVLGFSDAL